MVVIDKRIVSYYWLYIILLYLFGHLKFEIWAKKCSIGGKPGLVDSKLDYLSKGRGFERKR